MDAMTNEELLAEYNRTGNKDLMGVLYLRLKPLFVNVLARIVGRSEAEDAYHISFIKLLQHAGQYHGRAKVVNWMWAIASRTGIDYFRRTKKSCLADWDSLLEVFADVRDPIALLEEKSREQSVLKAVSNLPIIYRELACYLYMDGMLIRQVALLLGVPTGTIKSRMFRMKALLRKELESYEV